MELLKCFAGQRKLDCPLNGLDIENGTGMSMVPEAVRATSLQVRLGKKPDEWFIAATAGAISALHMDKVGMLTWMIPIHGSKGWYNPSRYGVKHQFDSWDVAEAYESS